jgi:tetratricopeptide (TPR) repeat protein
MGSVRRSPDTIRVNAQLVSGHDGVERWAQTYDRAPGDAIKIQTDIAANVAQALSITLGQAGRAALTLGGTADSVAQDLVLQARKLGRQADNAESYHRRVALAEGAIARDPQYADAYVEKANAISILARTFPATPADAANKLAEAEVAAQKAIAVAPRLGTGHTALAQIAQARFDFVNGLRHTRQALKLSPQDPEVLSSASRDLAYLASPQDALQLIDRAIGLDPLNGRLYRVKSEVLLRSLRHYQQAIQAGRKALEIAPEVHNAHIYVGDALLFLGYPDKAKAEYQALPSDTGFRMIREAIIVARKGDRAEAQRMISQIKQQLGTSYSYQYGEIYAQLGDKDRAFDELDNALQIRDSGLLYFRADPFLDPIRDDPRYAALLRKLKFP